MRNKNTKIKGVIATALLVLPMFAFAEDTSTGSTEVSSGTTNTGSVQVPVSESIVLKGKIEGYKVILSWTPYTGSTELAGYKIVVTNPNGETQIQSIGKEKTTADNWQGKPGNNVFQVFAMSGSAELLASNKVELRMGPNGNYDFGTGSIKPKEPYGTGSMQPREPIGTGSMQPREPYKVPQTGTTTSEQRTKFDEIMKALEVEIVALRSTITPNNHDEIKQKAETLKATYIAKLEPLGLGSMKNAIEYRFQVFYQSNFSGSGANIPDGTKPQGPNNEQKAKMDYLMKSLETDIKALRESITPNNKDEVKTKAEALKATYLTKLDSIGLGNMKGVIEQRFQMFYQNNFGTTPPNQGQNLPTWNKEPNKPNDNKDRKDDEKYNHPAPQNQNGLVAKYKAKFAKSLDAKLSTLSVEKMKSIVTKIDGLITKYQSSDIEAPKKEAYIAQLTALKSLLQDKIDESENTLDVESLFQD